MAETKPTYGPRGPYPPRTTRTSPTWVCFGPTLPLTRRSVAFPKQPDPRLDCFNRAFSPLLQSDQYVLPERIRFESLTLSEHATLGVRDSHTARRTPVRTDLVTY